MKTPLKNSKIKWTCQCYFCTMSVLTNKCQYLAIKLSKFTTSWPQLYVFEHIDR